MISGMEKLEAIEKAILDLQSGKRVTTVQYGDTRVQYAEVDLDKLLQIQSQIKVSCPRKIVPIRSSQIIMEELKE